MIKSGRLRTCARFRRPRCHKLVSRDGASVVVRALRPGEFLADAWKRALRELSEASEVLRADGATPKRFGFVAGGPSRSLVGGFRDSRFQRMSPQPAALHRWLELNSAPTARWGLGFDVLGPALVPRQRVFGPSWPASAHGRMFEYASRGNVDCETAVPSFASGCRETS